MGESVEFRPAEWVTAGPIGEPGQRTFFVQARSGARTIALLVEKGQVFQLAQLAQELLARVDVVVTPDDLDEAAMRPVPGVDPLWRAGTMSLGMDPEGATFLLEAEELVDAAEDAEDAEEPDPATVQLWMDREQLVALAAYAAYAVEAGARERCRLCSRPIDPVAGHVCPATNGHGPLTV